jgi:hypothetical protein
VRYISSGGRQQFGACKTWETIYLLEARWWIYYFFVYTKKKLVLMNRVNILVGQWWYYVYAPNTQRIVTAPNVITVSQ